MREPLFQGVCTALVTPFLDGKINYPMLDQLLKRQIDAGIHAVVIAGTTGESATLSDQEKLNLFRRAKEFVADQCLIIAGTGSNDTAHAIELSEAAEEVGADGLLIVSPYYNKATADGIVLHYSAVCQSVSCPVIVYNVPSRTGMDIPVSVYQRLSHIQNIAGIKEASPDISKIARIRASCGADFPIWSGNDDQIVPVMALGGVGVISVLSNVMPTETKIICDAALCGNYSIASNMQCKLLPLIDALFSDVNPIPAKAAMKEIGYDCGDCRLPLCKMDAEKFTQLKYLLS